MNNKFYGFFWKAHIFWAKQTTFKINKNKNYQFIRMMRKLVICTRFLFTMNPVGCRLKTVEGVGFEVTSYITFQELFFITCIVEKFIITYQEPIEGIKVWILLRFPCNILWNPSKYFNYTSKKKLGLFFHSPCQPQWITFLIVISQKNIIDDKRCRIWF